VARSARWMLRATTCPFQDLQVPAIDAGGEHWRVTTHCDLGRRALNSSQSVAGRCISRFPGCAPGDSAKIDERHLLTALGSE
jgi:hypothetical protein